MYPNIETRPPRADEVDHRRNVGLFVLFSFAAHELRKASRLSWVE